MSISKRVCKASCVSSYHGKLLSNSKEWLLLYSTKWINLKNTVLTEKKPDTRKCIPRDSIFMIIKNWQDHSTGRQKSERGCPWGWWEGMWWWGELMVKEYKRTFLRGKKRSLLCLRVVKIAKTHWAENLKLMHSQNTKKKKKKVIGQRWELNIWIFLLSKFLLI